MKPNDERLSTLLKQWRGIEPKANFEANVWRQIRANATQPTERINLIELIGRLLWQPAWSMAAAVVVALAVGIWGGVASMPKLRDTSQAELQFLSSGTLAGSYLQMASKEAR
jgi:hypothetical protein